MWVNLSMPRPDLSRLTPAEKDALILGFQAQTLEIFEAF